MELDNTVSSTISKFTTEPLHFRGFSANVLPGTVGAPGFNLKNGSENFSMIDWGLSIKMANSSEEFFAVENIIAKWKGKNGFICKSINFLTNVNKLNYDNDCNAMDELLKNNTQKIILPFLIKPNSEIIINVNFCLDIFVRKFPIGLEKFSFKREEIKEPETYHNLYQKSSVMIKLNGKWRSLTLKPQEFLVAGDTLIIPETKNL